MISEQSVRNFLGVKLARRGGGRRAEHSAPSLDSQLQQMMVDATPHSCFCWGDGYKWCFQGKVMIRACARSHALAAIEKQLARMK